MSKNYKNVKNSNSSRANSYLKLNVFSVLFAMFFMRYLRACLPQTTDTFQLTHLHMYEYSSGIVVVIILIWQCYLSEACYANIRSLNNFIIRVAHVCYEYVIIVVVVVAVVLFHSSFAKLQF